MNVCFVDLDRYVGKLSDTSVLGVVESIKRIPLKGEGVAFKGYTGTVAQVVTMVDLASIKGVNVDIIIYLTTK